MSSIKLSESTKKPDTKIFVNKYLNNHNNKDSDIFNINQTSSSNISNGSKRLRKNQDNSADEIIITKPYKRISKIPHPISKQNETSVLKNKAVDMNISSDQILNNSNTFLAEDQNKITFGRPFNKHKRVASMDTKETNYDRLICNNCLNTQLVAVKNLNTRKIEEGQAKCDGNAEFVDNLNKNREQTLNKKLKNREELSELASKAINQTTNKKKEIFQEICEKDVFPLYKRSIDPAQRRVMVKNMVAENITEKYADKFLNSKTEKDRYYDKYVENKNVQPLLNNIGSNFRESNRQEYLKGLLEQSIKNESLADKQSTIERNKGIETVYLNKIKFDMAEKEKLDRDKKLKDDFIEQNRILQLKKIKKTIVQKHVENECDKEFLVKNNAEFEKQNQEIMMKKSLNKNQTIRALDNQMNEKKSKIQSQTRNNLEESNHFCNKNECKIPCYKCNKPYPMKMLNNNSTVFVKK